MRNQLQPNIEPEHGDFITEDTNEIEAEVNYDISTRVRQALKKRAESGLWNVPDDFMGKVEITRNGRDVQLASNDERVGKILESGEESSHNEDASVVVEGGQVAPKKATHKSLKYGIMRDIGDDSSIADAAFKSVMDEGQSLIDAMHRPDERNALKKPQQNDHLKERYL